MTSTFELVGLTCPVGSCRREIRFAAINGNGRGFLLSCGHTISHYDAQVIIDNATVSVESRWPAGEWQLLQAIREHLS